MPGSICEHVQAVQGGRLQGGWWGFCGSWSLLLFHDTLRPDRRHWMQPHPGLMAIVRESFLNTSDAMQACTRGHLSRLRSMLVHDVQSTHIHRVAALPNCFTSTSPCLVTHPHLYPLGAGSVRHIGCRLLSQVQYFACMRLPGASVNG